MDVRGSSGNGRSWWLPLLFCAVGLVLGHLSTTFSRPAEAQARTAGVKCVGVTAVQDQRIFVVFRAFEDGSVEAHKAPHSANVPISKWTRLPLR